VLATVSRVDLNLYLGKWYEIARYPNWFEQDENTRFAPGDIRGMEPRFSPDNLKHNVELVSLVKQWAAGKQAAPGQIGLAWLLAQKPWIVPIPGTTQMSHMIQNVGASSITFTADELKELNASLANIQIQGKRLPDGILASRA